MSPLPRIASFLGRRWREDGGYRQVLSIAFPLILSTGAWSIQHFVDRMFLTWYSAEAVAASMPAGMMNFCVMALFLGTAGYVSTFVAQYYGAGRHDRIGPSVWQGIYIALLGGVVMAALYPLAGPLFRWVGHAPGVRQNEIVYFRILCLGATPALASAAFSGFYSGRGRTWPTMWVNVAATAANLVLDYGMIFGRLGFREMGMAGAALATVLSQVAAVGIWICLLANRRHDARFHTLRGWRPDRDLLRRLVRFGAPSGLHFFLDVAGFAAFILFVGRLGTVELAATNIAFNINSLAFLPMIGCGIAISIRVGQELGMNRPAVAERSVWSGAHIMMAYMGLFAVLYLVCPRTFVRPFARQASPEEFRAIFDLTVTLLHFVSAYCLFDALGIVFSAAMKGAGDTAFVMWTIGIASVCLLVAPTWLLAVRLGGGVYAAWGVATGYIILLSFIFLARFLGGKWKTMRVIEEPVAAVPAPLPPAPTPNVEA